MANAADGLTLFLCGDVMTGRGIDQILPHSCAPELHEPHVKDARKYVELAEAVNGKIAAPVLPSYVWSDAPTELQRVQPDLGIINLETSITTSIAPWPDKPVLYHMHPGVAGQSAKQVRAGLRHPLFRGGRARPGASW